MADKAKRNELKRRLYDSGISNVPMPSVKRPIEENMASRPFSARMNSNKYLSIQIYSKTKTYIYYRIQSLSPLKKMVQDLNTQIIRNMNDSYQEAALIEARNLGEGTADYYKKQQNILSGSFSIGANTLAI